MDKEKSLKVREKENLDQSKNDNEKNSDKKEIDDQASLLNFLKKVDKAAEADGEIDPLVTDTIKTWMKDLKGEK